MNTVKFDPRPMNQLDVLSSSSSADWLWDGYIARGNITLLTSQWKAGKTTMVAGLLRALGDGGAFLDRPCSPATAVVVSEESPAMWAARQRAIPIGPHVKLVSRPFPGRPTTDQWDELIRHAEDLRTAGTLDVLAVDPLASFLPGRSESDPSTLLNMLHPLRRLAETGVAVLILHHPRKQSAEDGSKSRGSGALLGFVDVILELNRCSKLASDSRRRRLVAFSRHSDTPHSLVYEWTAGSSEFRAVPDMFATRFLENWQTVESLLADRDSPATARELLDDWPPNQTPPVTSQLYEWLSRAVKEKLVIRVGSGTRSYPYRFHLNKKRRPPKTELPDLPTLPPIELVKFRFG